MWQRNALDGIRSEDFRQLVPVVLDVVQLGTADDHRFPPEKILVEVRVGERNTIGNDEKVCILEIGGIDRHEFELHWPMGECRRRAGLGLRSGSRICRFEMHGPR